MPLYEYKCISCEKVHEVMQKFSDPRLENCPDCNGTVEKLLSRSSFSLKGTGWYTTDYKAKPAPTPSPRTAQASSSGDSASASKVEGESSKAKAGEAQTPSSTPAASPAASSSPAPTPAK